MSRADENRAAYAAKCRAAEQARCAALGVPTFAEAKAARKAKRASKPRKSRRTEDSAIANHVDGFDRDNLGESPDY